MSSSYGLALPNTSKLNQTMKILSPNQIIIFLIKQKANNFLSWTLTPNAESFFMTSLDLLHC